MTGCWWRGHDWGRWEYCTVSLHEDGRFLGTVGGQVRECKRCGVEKVRRNR